MAKFRFELQAALDHAEVKREQAEAALMKAREELRAAEETLRKLEEKLQEVVQRIRREHDHLVRPPDPSEPPRDPRFPSQQDELIRALRVREQARQKAVDEQQAQVGFCRQKVAHRQAELREASGKEQALQRLREKALEEHRKVEQRRLQEEIDEAGIQRSARRPNQGP